MIKLKWIIVPFVFFAGWSAFAQTGLFQSAPQTATPPKSTTLSPSEFKNRVQSLGQTNQQQVQQQVDQTFSKIKPVAQPAQPSVIPPPAPQQPAASSKGPIESDENFVPQPDVMPPSVSSTEAPATAPPPAQAAPQQPAQQPVRQPYTGFQGSGSTGTTQPSSSGGGWNVKY